MFHPTLKKILPSLGLLVAVPLAAESYKPSSIVPPKPAREFRGAWVATVGNAVWPSRKDLSTAEQKAELIAILDRAVELNLNAIIFQVRPACDAMYASQIEPWSEFLTGTMGEAPKPFYDPLEFAVVEAHKRGLELHAWFNPYRARTAADKSASVNHISRTHPELVRQYGKLHWLDPGEKVVQDYSLGVVMDVVKRYDVDAVHFDDYFYPYKVQDATGADLDFPDDASWKKFGAGGKLSRDDWRRENVNVFIQRVYQSIKTTKSWVKFGISPFGIWRPGIPEQIKGHDAYAKLYADSRKWLQSGWVDYFAPQLYWGIEPKEQSYPVLLKWWAQQNTKTRHLWPGLNATKTSGQSGSERSREARWKPDEIINQIWLARKQSGVSGEIFWSMKSLMSGRGPLGDSLKDQIYSEPALVPASPWLDRQPPAKPKLAVENSKATWSSTSGEKTSLWVLQTRQDNKWTSRILPGEKLSATLADKPSVIAITAIDRVGNASAPAVLQNSTKQPQ